MAKKNDERLEITVCKWDQVQKKMANPHRQWIRLNTNLLHDPEVMRMTLESRWLWIAVLLHAGCVGPVFNLSASDARVLFQLRRNADFSPLIDQGFISVRAMTQQRGEDITEITERKKTPKKKVVKKKKTAVVKIEFEDLNNPLLNLKAFNDFQEHRKEIKKPMTEKAMTLTANKLMKLTHEDQQRCVDNSIEGGWQGLFPEKLNEGGGFGRKRSYGEQLEADMREKGMIE